MQQAISRSGTTSQDTMADLTMALLEVVQQAKRHHGTPDSMERGALAMLAQLGGNGEVRGTELAAHACLDASTVSRHLRSLEAAGYISRRPDPLDARAALIGITDAGRDILSRAIAERVTLFNRATAAWTDHDRATLTRLVRRLADDLETL